MSSLSIGIVGLPNVGKSTLFNALTSNQALAANYPFATIDPNVGIVDVPDWRLQQLKDLYPESPLTPATIQFTDIAGLVEGASQGEGLGNQFLANIREVNAIAHVVRTFADENVSHVEKTPDPGADIETINTELILADIQTLTKRKTALVKTARNDSQAQADLNCVDTFLDSLDQGKLLVDVVGDTPLDTYLEKAKTSDELSQLTRQLLTVKPMVYIFNIDEDTMADDTQKQDYAKLVTPSQSIFICAKLEAELSQLNDSEASELLSEYGQDLSGMEQFIQAGYEALGLVSFLTAGEKEIRAWPIPEGSTAPQAAGTIHGDFERGFIAAEVINWQDLIQAGSKSAARTQGLIRTEGKSYQILDGDVVEFRFNV